MFITFLLFAKVILLHSKTYWRYGIVTILIKKNENVENYFFSSKRNMVLGTQYMVSLPVRFCKSILVIVSHVKSQVTEPGDRGQMK
jgi:hypothetical protein